MRRFILTYQQEGHSMEIEGVEFSSLIDKPVVIETEPYGESNSPSVFHNIAHMEYKLNEFGETSIKWLDEVETS